MPSTSISLYAESYNLTEKQFQDYRDDEFLSIEDFFSVQEQRSLENYCIQF